MTYNDKRIDLLNNVSIFSTLKEDELKIVAQYSDYDEFKSGEYIFREGSSAEELFIIKEGEVVIRKLLEDKKEIDLARFISGECFGEMDLLDIAPRNASAVAEKETILLRFPKAGVLFIDVLYKHPKIFASILSKLLAQIAGRIRQVNKLVSEKTPWIEDLRKQLLSDKLTGLYNRAFIEEDFVQNFTQYGNQFSLMMIKPDEFKRINDGFGHEAGDKVIRLLADTLKKTLTQKDIAARYRGNEFASILPDNSPEEADQMAKKILQSIKKIDLRNILNTDTIQLTASIGISVYPKSTTDPKDLIKIAYERMHNALKSGGDRIVS